MTYFYLQVLDVAVAKDRDVAVLDEGSKVFARDLVARTGKSVQQRGAKKGARDAP